MVTTTAQKLEFFYYGFLQLMRPNQQATADLVLFTEEALNGKLHFLLGTFFHIYLRSHLHILIM